MSDILLCADDDIDTVTLSRLGRNVRSQEQLDDVLTSWRLSSEYNADLRFNWMVHLVHVHFSRSNKISPGMDWILSYRREMVSAHQSFSCVGFYAGPGPVSSFIKTIDIKH